jgi:hypothetical protein
MYRKKQWFADYYQIGKTSVQNIMNFISDQIGYRYPQASIIHTGKIIRIRRDVFQDAMQYRDSIEYGVDVPEFREERIET